MTTPCPSEIHQLDVHDTLELVAEELERVVVRFYTATGDNDTAADMSCLAAHARQLIDREEPLASVCDRINYGLIKTREDAARAFQDLLVQVGAERREAIPTEGT